MKSNNNKIINIIVYCILGLALIFGIYLFIKFQINKKNVYKEEIYNYLSQDNLVLLGVLNYDFDNIDKSVSSEFLVNTRFMENSMLDSEGIDNIYKSLYNVTREKYLSASNYVSNPNQNCYYYQNTLMKNGYNCDKVCSMSTSSIISEIENKLGWDNVLEEDAINYCKKNAVYSIEGSGYFVDLNKLGTLYKNIFNKDISFDTDIVGNKYYKYGAYLADNISSITKYIESIESIDNVKIKNDMFIVTYEAKLSDESIVEGKVTLEKDNDNYYVVSNSIGIGYNF